MEIVSVNIRDTVLILFFLIYGSCENVIFEVCLGCIGAGMCISTMCVQCPPRPEEVVKSSRAGVRDDVSPCVGAGN